MMTLVQVTSPLDVANVSPQSRAASLGLSVIQSVCVSQYIQNILKKEMLSRFSKNENENKTNI